MKPIGTITACFPHVDEETKIVLATVMTEAENFADFTKKLCERVCKEETTPLLEYFAVYFSFRLGLSSLIDRLQDIGKVCDLALPLMLLDKVSRGKSMTWSQMRAAQVSAIKAAPNDWIVCHQYLTWRIQAESLFPDSDVDVQSIDAITLSVNQHQDLKFFESYLHWLTASHHVRDNNRALAVEELKQALVIAREFDEQVMIVDLLINIVNNIKHTNYSQAMDLLKSSKKLSEQLGFTYAIGIAAHHMGHIMSYRGELDAAIECQAQYGAMCESLGVRKMGVNLITAAFLNYMGNGGKALELLEGDRESWKANRRILPFFHTQMAYAWINLGNLDKARLELSVAEEMAIKSGDARQILRSRVIEGILEKEECDFDAAISTFKEVMDYLEDNPTPIWQDLALLSLTEIEIEQLTDEQLEQKPDTSGPWMQRLFQHVEKNDLPGIAAHALLLKAELRRKQKRFDDMRKLLKQVQKTAKAPSMKYLNDLAVSMFPDIIVD